MCVLRKHVDSEDHNFKDLKKHCLKLVFKFCKLGTATEKLIALAGKKLIKLPQTRWNYIYFALKRLHDVCMTLIADMQKVLLSKKTQQLN